jgi:hypothetical protein
VCDLFVKQAIHFGFVPGRDVVVQAIPLRLGDG